jgi:hypothetical protein
MALRAAKRSNRCCCTDPVCFGGGKKAGLKAAGGRQCSGPALELQICDDRVHMLHWKIWKVWLLSSSRMA